MHTLVDALTHALIHKLIYIYKYHTIAVADAADAGAVDAGAAKQRRRC